MAPDGDDDVRQLRAFMQEHGLLPPVDHLLRSPEQVAELASRITQTPRRTERTTRRRPALLVAAIVAILLVTALVARQVGRAEPAAASDTPPMLTFAAADLRNLVQAPAASEALDAAAERARGAAAVSGGGDVQYVATYGWTLTDTSSSTATSTSVRAIYPTATEQWLGPDGSLRTDQQRAAALNLDGTIQRTSTSTSPIGSDSLPAGSIDPHLIQTLPRDPTTIAAALITGLSLGGCDATSTQCLVTAIESLYTTYVVPPDLASTLWQALADQPDLTSLGTTTDRIGARVDAIAYTGTPGTLEVLLISTDTGRLSGSETIALRDASLNVARPAVVAFTTIGTAQWVEAVGDMPRAGT